jgi:hypothetical protein
MPVCNGSDRGGAVRPDDPTGNRVDFHVVLSHAKEARDVNRMFRCMGVALSDWRGPASPLGMNMGDLEYREGRGHRDTTGSRDTGLLSA